MNKSPLIISFLNVGHGDSIVIILPSSNNQEKRAIVIDSPKGEKTLDYLRQNNVKHIETIYITHPDTDHYMGISYLVSNFLKIGQIGSICFNNVKEAIGVNGKYKQLLRLMANYNHTIGIKLIPGFIQDSCIENSIENCNITMQYPTYAELTEAITNSNSNNMSIVLQIKYFGHTILLPGDLEHEGWLLINNRIDSNTCDILKLPHHGDHYDQELTTEKIIDYTQPSIAIISTAENESYNHPNVETINILKDKNIHVYCTQATRICSDRCKEEHCPCANDIIISIDKNKMEIIPDQKALFSIKSCFENAKCI